MYIERKNTLTHTHAYRAKNSSKLRKSLNAASASTVVQSADSGLRSQAHSMNIRITRFRMNFANSSLIIQQQCTYI